MARSSFRTKFQLSALALALAALPLGASAAGLGNLKVLSVLGQPLLAEIDMTTSREEAATLAARIAPHEAFQQAGIEYNPVLSDIKVSIEKRADKRLYLQLRTDQALNEPFLDLLLEMSWAAGRLQREYLFLLDPPDALQKNAPQDMAGNLPVAGIKPTSPTATATPAPAAAGPDQVTAARSETAPRKKSTDTTDQTSAESATARDTAQAARSAQARTTATHLVKPGDTLSKIAGEALQTMPADVNLDQMLIALFRNNREAFTGGNINRLRAGKILTLPDHDSINAVNPREARELVIAQAADFAAYRKKLAAATEAAPAMAEAAPQQSASGKIATQVEEKLPPPVSKDKLEVSKSAAIASKDKSTEKTPAARAAALEEDTIAHEKTLQEANSRITELDRNLAEMRQALALKSQTLATAEQQATTAQTHPATETTAAAPAAQPAKKPAKKKKPAQPPKVDAAEPSFLDDNPQLIYGGAGILALLLGYLGFNQWRKKRTVTASASAASSAPAGGSSNELSMNSVFDSNGGQVVDTGSTADSSLDTDFSVIGSSGADASESVDPIAEADVYMAYGRNAQAEEILLDAMKKDPARHAIPLKLLEIYAARKSLKQFEGIASDLRTQTSGTGEHWEKAAALGRSIDPENPLYNPTSAADTAQDTRPELYDPTATMVLTPQDFDKIAAEFDTPATTAADASIEAAAASMEAELEEIPASLDFEIDLGTGSEPLAGNDTSTTLDFDLGHSTDTAAQPTPVPTPTADALPNMAVDASAGSSTTGGGQIDFESIAASDSTPDSLPAETTFTPPPSSAAASGIDLASISLELDEHSIDHAPDTPAATADTFSDPDIPPLSPAAESLTTPLAESDRPAAPATDEAGSPEIDTKLELAAAYEEMGDQEGARELLQEVLNEGNTAQQAAARTRLAQLG